MAALTVAGSAVAQHVPPDPPQHLLPHQSYEQMAEMMRMDDTERYGRVTVDQLEWQRRQSCGHRLGCAGVLRR